VATGLRATRRSWTLAFEGSAQFAPGVAPCRETRPRPLGHPRLHVARTSGSDHPGAELGRCSGRLIKAYPAFRRCRGDRRPNPGALGNRDLVVVVRVAPVNLAGLKSLGPDHPCTRSRRSAANGSRLSGLGRSRIAGLTGLAGKQTHSEERLSARCSSQASTASLRCRT
jgi:hypothetical protein